VLNKLTAEAAWLRPSTTRRERLSTRAAILLVSLATLFLWLGLAEALVQWM
jgi:hypothetical protein